MSEEKQSSLGSALASPRASLKRIKVYQCVICKKNCNELKMIPGLKYCSTSCMFKGEEQSKSVKVRVKELRRKKKKEERLSNKNCLHCRNKIIYERKQSKFCSKICKIKYNEKKALQKKRKTNVTRIDLWSELNRDKWIKLRYEVFKKYGRKCMVCGSTDKLHVDHIKPKSKYPELCWDINNLQILCEPCNIGKGYEHEDDWRPKERTQATT